MKPKVEEARLQGIPGQDALLRLLELRRINITPFDEENVGEDSVDGILVKLREYGLDVRPVQANEDDVERMSLPTLIQLKDLGWAVLRGRKRGVWDMEHAGGRVRVLGKSAGFSGLALEINPPFPEQGGIWKRLIRLLPEYRNFLFMSLMATALVQGLALLAPWFTSRMLDGALGKGAISLLSVLCMGMLLTALFRAWIGYLRDITLQAFTTRVDVALERGLFEHILNLPFKYVQSKTLGELLQAFGGIKRARNLVLNRGLSAIFDGFLALAYLVYMLALMPKVTGLVVAGSLALALSSSLIGYFQSRASREQIKASQAQHSALAELLKGAPTLKATGSQHWVLKRWKDRLGLELAATLKMERLGLWEDGISEILTQGSSICILIWGGYNVLHGELSLGNLMAFTQLSSAFVGSITSLSQTALSVAMARPQMKEAQEAFATARLPRVKNTVKTLNGPVLAEDVWFRYEDKGPWVLQGMHLRVEKGTFHHVKGPSGWGKSTFLKLMAGLYLPDTGRISYGGVDPVGANGLMVFLPQFPQLSSGSILENLRIFSGDVSKAHLFKVAEETGLDEWVKSLPMGYQTMVASGGANLSGGQRQLVAITAVLASDKQVLLLDEALSNLDWVSRQKVIHNPRLQGRTIIYASHEEVLMGAK